MRSERARRPPLDGRPHGRAIHATAVAIGDRGLLIVGPSGAGKSRLAAALIADSTPRLSIRLVGDDRILVADEADRLVARPHPRIAGFIERRGLGIVALPFVPAVEVRGVVRLGLEPGSKTPMSLCRENFPGLPFVNLYDGRGAEVSALVARTLDWFRGACTTPFPKPTAAEPWDAKD